MTALVRFLAYNLLVSLVAGALAWLVVRLVVGGLRLRAGTTIFCFLALPVVKSLLLVLGVGVVFPWPSLVFLAWHAQALPFGQLWPWLLLWGISVFLLYRLAVWRARQTLLAGALPATSAAPRLAAAYETVSEAYRRAPRPSCAEELCCVREKPLQPNLLVSEHLDSPLALTDGGAPAILFPSALVSHLDDDELACALAHERAHFVLRRRDWCSAGTLQFLTLLNPVAGLAGEYLHRQEEIACDDLAVSIVPRPETFASMLTKCYRFARGQASGALSARLHLLPRLVGFRPLLSERVERLLAPRDIAPQSASTRPAPSPFVVWLVWGCLAAALFFVGSH